MKNLVGDYNVADYNKVTISRGETVDIDMVLRLTNQEQLFRIGDKEFLNDGAPT